MKQYIIDAFTDKVFSGNPAAICILDEWLSNETMLLIAKENNLSETAFLVNKKLKMYTNSVGLRQAVKLIYVDMPRLPVLL